MASEAESPVVIHAWSAPRSLSTSLMYSFAQVCSSSSYALFAPQLIMRRERGGHKRMGTRSSARSLAQLQREHSRRSDEGWW